MYQMDIKYTNKRHFENYPNCDFWFWNYAIWQPWVAIRIFRRFSPNFCEKWAREFM
jgi:hypothetical protein